MKISIITVVRNNKETIQDAMGSVLAQDYADVEYIVVDGASRDGTIDAVADMIRQYPEKDIIFLSERDQGLYDAMNKGIKMASGDVVGILNSDDFYAHDRVLSRVAAEMEKTGVDCVLGDLVIVKKNDVRRIVRYYRSAGFSPRWFAYGQTPPHPTFFAKRVLYDRHGLFKKDYEIAADYELLTRMFSRGGVRYSYIPEILVHMRSGGRSGHGLRSTYVLNKEILRACRENGVRTNMLKIYSKYFTKVFQLWHRPLKKGPDVLKQEMTQERS